MLKWTSLVAAIGCLFLAANAAAQSASVKAAPKAEVGSKLEVRWTGPAAKGDFVSIDKAGAPDNTYGPYAYPSAGNPLTLLVPTAPGQYEIRYHAATGGYPVLPKPRSR